MGRPFDKSQGPSQLREVALPPLSPTTPFYDIQCHAHKSHIVTTRCMSGFEVSCPLIHTISASLERKHVYIVTFSIARWDTRDDSFTCWHVCKGKILSSILTTSDVWLPFSMQEEGILHFNQIWRERLLYMSVPITHQHHNIKI